MWLDIATVSATSTLSPYRVCSAANNGTDIACPSIAPYVHPVTGGMGIGTATPYSQLEVSSTSSTELTVNGYGDGHHQGALVLKGFDHSMRANGIYLFNNPGGYEWYAGTPYNQGDAFSINRITTAVHNAVAAHVTNSLFIIRNDGKVGIGTANPTSKLTVRGNNTNQIMAMEDGSGRSISLNATSNNQEVVASAGNLNLKPAAGQVNVYTASGDGSLAVLANNGNSWTTIIRSNGASVFNGGNVGIGTFFPQSKLEVVGTVSATQFRGDGSLLTGITATPAGVSGSLQFNNGLGGLAGRNDVVVDASGHVGIGTANVTSKLEVAGKVSATLVKVADNGEACTAASLGTIRFVNGRASLCTSR